MILYRPVAKYCCTVAASFLLSLWRFFIKYLNRWVVERQSLDFDGAQDLAPVRGCRR